MSAVIFPQAADITVPDYWTMGEVYERLIEDVCGDEEDRVVECLIEVYTSWIDDALPNAMRKEKSVSENKKRGIIWNFGY